MKAFKHMTAFVLALVMAAALAVTAYAASVTVKYRVYVYSDEITFRQYDYSQSTTPSITNLTISATSGLGSGSALYHMKYADGAVAYCIEPGVHSDDSGTYKEGSSASWYMMVWSTEPEKGYLTREGIAAMRSRMTNAIFHEEMKELYIKKDAAYKESIQTAKESLLLYIRMLENSELADPVIEQKLWELSHALEQVDGKRVYAYLPKEVKAQVDEIVERLAQLPEVAACYDQWWRLKDKIAGYYGRNTPPHQPLSQQKEFRAIKNFIIREAETICEPTPVQTSTDAEPRESRESSDETPTAVQQPLPEMPRTDLPADAVMQLLLHMSRMFRGNMPVIPPALRIDSKRRRRLQEKRMAMGHKRDGHEDEQLYHVNDNTMR